MFLNMLEERNKRNFLKLCVHAALSDGEFVNDEAEMIHAYCREMNISEAVPEVKESLEDILKEMAENTNDTEKRIITLEVLGLVKSDGVYDDREKAFMKKVIESMEIKKEILDELEYLLEQYTGVYRELYSVILG